MMTGIPNTACSLVSRFGALPCWLICNSAKAPCDRTGHALERWQTKGATFDVAARFVGGPVRGLGIRVDAAPGLLALDFDHVLNGAGGVIDSLSLSVLFERPSFCEVTWSGVGLRAYYLVDGPHDKVALCLHHGREPFGHEVYFAAPKFVIVTGSAYCPTPGGECPSEPAAISPAQLDAWVERIRRNRVLSREDEGRELRAICAVAPDDETAAAIRECETNRAGDLPRQANRATVAQAVGDVAAVVARLRAAREGERNSLLLWSACRLYDRGMSQAGVEAELLPAALSVGLPEREALATIRSACQQDRRAVRVPSPECMPAPRRGGVSAELARVRRKYGQGGRP
jgi:hypothetical protein